MIAKKLLGRTKARSHDRSCANLEHDHRGALRVLCLSASVGEVKGEGRAADREGFVAAAAGTFLSDPVFNLNMSEGQERISRVGS